VCTWTVSVHTLDDQVLAICHHYLCRRAIRKAEEAGLSELEISRENERDALIAGGPSSLSREDPMREPEVDVTGATDESKVNNLQFGTISTSELSKPPNGIFANLIGAKKAKRSPNSRLTDAMSSYGSKGGGSDATNGDLEMGSGLAQGMTSNRRRSANKSESDDEVQKY